ncbi:Glycoside hydrolase, superfamily [Metarhizium album ARSEF 1941]|uniref:Glycoside hydrolase, superfamily n=1 Tax=Metarhizium album (strain ARSEF 1941) TaxID=1081103 RepID=A0A0B2X8D5_METAS|nr:Glycoside hydrolase, superfamily [Metarhizium album ARSEF 1941]KHO01760.1 Glycoside hydrolase, superfamily [Metarhizium album ARSEF 1941]
MAAPANLNSEKPNSNPSSDGSDLDALWHNLDWAIGQMLIMGWDGTEVTPQIKSLIEDHHLGSIILTAKNLKCWPSPAAQETAKLVQELQTIAKNAGHPQPLLIAVDQENGGVNSLFDEDYVCQFPSAMGIAATGRVALAYEISKATATEISACGVNLMLGPVLDVLSNARYQPLGVRSTGDDPQEASQYGLAALNGVRDAGIAAAGKHFPSYGNLDFQGSNTSVPVITQTLEELSLSALVPFRNAIATGKLDAMFVGGCGISNPSMNVGHACLSDQVVDDLLRNELGFKGVAISECLEMEALGHDLGVRNGVIMAVEAGCDLLLLCRAYDVQLEAIKGLRLGYEDGIITKDRIFTSIRRILHLKSTCTSWATALNPPGISLLSQLHPSHLSLSRRAYDESITVIRDKEKLLPLSNSMHPGEELLLLTPLVKPLPASAMTKSLLESKKNWSQVPTQHDSWAHRDRERSAIMSGEGVFREFGKNLARYRNEKLLHTSYTANGVRPVHENLIARASCIIIVTADANRNMYQAGFTKHVDMMCSMHRSRGNKKQLIVVAVSSPYDFAMDKSIGTYICTFDFTEDAMSALVRVLVGEITPIGTMPGTLRKSKKVLKSRQHWLVEEYDRARDYDGLEDLLKAVHRASAPDLHFLKSTRAESVQLHLPNLKETHFVVRNSSTGALYGFVATYFIAGVGIIGALLVDPSKRNVSIGRSLHRRALKSLCQLRSLKKIQVGTSFPGVFLGIPLDPGVNTVKEWFSNSGWDTQFPRRLTNMIINDLANWAAPEGLLQSIQRANISFDLIHGLENAESVLHHVCANANPEVLELYTFALSENKACGIVRAKDPSGNLIGTVIICRQGSPLVTYIPPLFSERGDIGGIIAPIVAPTPQTNLVLQGLALMGVRQSKGHKASKAVLSWVVDDAFEPLLAMGFEVLQAFEEITNSPDVPGANNLVDTIILGRPKSRKSGKPPNMATQQILFAETIAGMKKAFKRKAYGFCGRVRLRLRDRQLYQSRPQASKESEICTQGTIGAGCRPKCIQRGMHFPVALALAAVDYAGVRRNILYRNPPLVDDEGYEIVSDDDDDRVEEAELAAAECNPYFNIRLNHILAPLTASTELQHHPTLSKAFTSKTLHELVNQSCTLLRKENGSLWKVRHLWTSLCGDGVWMPCETMIGPNDIDFYSDDHVARFQQSLPNCGGSARSPVAVVNGTPNPDNTKSSMYGRQEHLDGSAADADASMMDASARSEEAKGTDNEAAMKSEAAGAKVDGCSNEAEGKHETAHTNGNGEAHSKQNGKDGVVTSDAHKEQSGGAFSSESKPPCFIHPIFLPPPGAKPDRNMGIPENEAEDIRRLLALYVQKQEEVARGAARLHQGLLRAERLRSNVLGWSKAEAHCGPNRDMSDGEDWYDKEEWGLAEDLKKGQDEEEEDATTSGKKTRNRRA